MKLIAKKMKETNLKIIIKIKILIRSVVKDELKITEN